MVKDCTNCAKNSHVCYDCVDDDDAWEPQVKSEPVDQKEKLIQELLKSDKIKRSYKIYIVKTIPFERWVRDMVDRNFEIAEETK